MKSTLKLTTALVAGATLGTAAAAQTELTMWYHGAGNEVEGRLINQIITDFNAAQSDWTVVIESFPQASYNDSVVAGALAGNLPCIIDVDGPVMPNWAWSGYMQPLNIDESLIEDFLPAAKGMWDGNLYSVGLWEAAVAMVTRRSYLEDNGIRVPTIEEPWTQDEFMSALDTLKATGQFDYPFDLGMAWTGEWYPYAFSPFLQSFGGDIVDRSTYRTAEGVLNGDAALAFGEWWQSLFEGDYVPGTSQDPADRDGGFGEGKYAISYNGNWAALNALSAFDDAIFLPSVDFGNGPKIGAASWQFGVSSTCETPEGANAFIEFALQDEYLGQFSNELGVIPPTASAAELTENYAEGGPMSAFFELSAAQALVRPVTPGYVVAAKVFEKALADIANGADVADTLDAAVDEIDADIESNGGYGH